MRSAAEPGSVRTARAREAVRAATAAEPAEHGFRGLTVENVAARSGVHKTTVYRRWGDAGGLVADALDAAAGEPWPVPDTGTLPGDLRAIARLVLTGFTDPAVVRRAAERGEVPTGTDAADVVRAAVAPLYHRLLITGEPVDEAVADRAAAAAVAAARAGVFAAGLTETGARRGR